MRPIHWAIVGGLLISLTFVVAQTNNPARSLIGKPAPDFTLPSVDGKKVRLSDFRGKVVLLNFFSHW